MNKPDYQGGSILNLISTISRARGSRTKYSSLKILKPSEINDSKNIVLMLIDGLGYEFLMKNGKGTIFNENIKGKMTSVFPSSTSAAIPGIMTGSSPQEHGMNGWFMYMKEFNGTIIPLPYITKTSSQPLGKLTEIKNVFNINPITKKLKTKSYLIENNNILNSDFSNAASQKSKKVGFNKMEGYFRSIKKIIKSNNQKKYIYAYYSDHDSLCHKNGSDSKKVLNHFKKLNKRMISFVNSLKGTDTTLIITADHGIINTPKNKIINMKNHPKLKETLSMPLSGEHRFAYCYVKPSKERDFLKYVKTKLKKYCEVHKSEDLLKKNYFGLFTPHKNFIDRIGDYTLIMKDNYSLYDNPEYQKEKHYHIGEHGGLSKEELYVPLIVIKK